MSGEHHYPQTNQHHNDRECEHMNALERIRMREAQAQADRYQEAELEEEEQPPVIRRTHAARLTGRLGNGHDLTTTPS